MLTFKGMKTLAHREEGKLRARKNFQKHMSPRRGAVVGMQNSVRPEKRKIQNRLSHVLSRELICRNLLARLAALLVCYIQCIRL